MPNTHVRVVGGGNTLVYMGLEGNKTVEFLSQFQDNPGGSVGRAEAIQPVGAKYPIEIATPYAQGAGTLTIEVWGTWGSDGWVSAFQYRSGGDHDDSPWKGYQSEGNLLTEGQPVDLYEVLDAQRKLGPDKYIKVYKVEMGQNGEPYRVKSYEGAVITDIQAGETVRNDTMTQTCRITMMYTRMKITNANDIGA